jgi:excisionase family DNA binding protein
VSAVAPFLVPPPSDADALLAGDGARTLARIVGKGDQARLQLEVDGQRLEVPLAAVKLLMDALAQMALGRAVQIVPHHAELTTQQAADFLNISRPHLIKLLEGGALPFHKAGTHRRIYFSDIVKFREQQRARQKAAVDELLQLSQEHGLDLLP